MEIITYLVCASLIFLPFAILYLAKKCEDFVNTLSAAVYVAIRVKDSKGATNNGTKL